MTPQEHDLIQSVFDRLARLAGGPKDPQAEALIIERLRAIPDSAYNLVEAVVVQEMAIKEREAHIAELERRLASAPPPQSQGGGFGQGAANPWGRGSVPSVPPQPQQYAPPQQQYAPPPQYPPQPQAPWGTSSGGGFLRNAASAAVGVAGGMLLAEGVSHMFGGGRAGGGFGGGSWGGGAPGSETVTENTTINNYYDSAPPTQAVNEVQPQFDTNVGDDGGGFDGGSDSF